MYNTINELKKIIIIIDKMEERISKRERERERGTILCNLNVFFFFKM